MATAAVADDHPSSPRVTTGFILGSERRRDGNDSDAVSVTGCNIKANVCVCACVFQLDSVSLKSDSPCWQVDAVFWVNPRLTRLLGVRRFNSPRPDHGPHNLLPPGQGRWPLQVSSQWHCALCPPASYIFKPPNHNCPRTRTPSGQQAPFLHHCPEWGQNQSERCRLNHHWLSGDWVHDGGRKRAGLFRESIYEVSVRYIVDLLTQFSVQVAAAPRLQNAFRLLFSASICRSDALSHSVSQCESIYKRGSLALLRGSYWYCPVLAYNALGWGHWKLAVKEAC